MSEILISSNPNAPTPEPGKESKFQEPTPSQVEAARAKIDEIYERLKKGAKFDEIARKESNGSTAEQGGDLGYFKRKDLARELEDKSFALKTGEYTGPIRTRQGFIILKVSDHIQAGTPSLESVRDQISEQLYSQKVQPGQRSRGGVDLERETPMATPIFRARWFTRFQTSYLSRTSVVTPSAAPAWGPRVRHAMLESRMPPPP